MDLGRADFKAVLDFLADIDAVDVLDPYADPVLERLRELIRGDEVVYQEADVGARRFLDVHGVDSSGGGEGADDEALYWSVGPCPIAEYRVRTTDVAAVRMSDLISWSRWRELPIYREYFGPAGMIHLLDMGLSVSGSTYRSLVLFRSDDVRDFSERDRSVVELLRPHLRAREARSRLAALVAGKVRALVAGSADDDVHLTTREREILAMVAAGKTNAQIATDLWVSPATVKKHLENVYLKLGVGSRAAAAMKVTSHPG